jgi:hypothetical protein
MHASTDPDSTPARRTGRPWRTALAGLLLLGIAGGMMAYGAPSRASTLSHSQAGGALVSATLREFPPRTPPGYYSGWGSPSAGGFR